MQIYGFKTPLYIRHECTVLLLEAGSGTSEENGIGILEKNYVKKKRQHRMQFIAVSVNSVLY